MTMNVQTLPQTQTPALKFKAQEPPRMGQITYKQQVIPAMQEKDISNDIFLMQAKEMQKAQKKEKSRDRWYKTGVLAQVGIALALCTTAIGTLMALKKGGKAEKNILKFKSLAQDSLPDLNSDSVNPKAKDFIKMVKERTGMDEKIAQYAGTKSAEQCVLFHGPSGTGKTFSAKLMAKELGAEYAEVDFPKIASPYVGQASININNVFSEINKQATKEPTKKFLVAFNEIDSMLIPMEKAGNNQSYVLENRTAFLNGLDSIKSLKNVKIVGTTNADPKTGNLDLAALSRFGNLFEVQLPTKKEIVASLKWHMKNCEGANKHNFFDNNKSAIEKFADDLIKRKFSQRDVEKLAENAQTRFGLDIAKKSNPLEQKFDIKYLKEALKNKEFTTGSMNGKNPQANANQTTIKDLNFIQRLILLFSGK